jgi:hypothetical protein
MGRVFMPCRKLSTAYESSAMAHLFYQPPTSAENFALMGLLLD